MKRVNIILLNGANVLAVASPFEVSRFEDAVKPTGNKHVDALGIFELLDKSMRGE